MYKIIVYYQSEYNDCSTIETETAIDLKTLHYKYGCIIRTWVSKLCPFIKSECIIGNCIEESKMYYDIIQIQLAFVNQISNFERPRTFKIEIFGNNNLENLFQQQSSLSDFKQS